MSALQLPTYARGARVCIIADEATRSSAGLDAWLASISAIATITSFIPTNIDALPATSFDAVFAVVSENVVIGQESGLQSVERALVPGGSFTQLVVSPTAEAAGAAARQLELTLGGFVDVSAAPAQPSASGSGVTVMISATTPNWNATAVPLLPRKAAAAKAAADLVTMTGVAGKGWVVASGAAGTAVDLIDENALLAGDDAVATSAAANSCTTKRRACANCSCGRAEAENAADTAVAPAPAAVSAAPVKSQCGNCFKGDAFRCATCPHLGKPAFKPGMDGALLLDTGASDF